MTGGNNQLLLVNLDLVTQPMHALLVENNHLMQVMLTPLRKPTVQNASLSSLVSFEREIILLIYALLLQKYKEYGPSLKDIFLLYNL